jgi:hypothetical protein
MSQPPVDPHFERAIDLMAAYEMATRKHFREVWKTIGPKILEQGNDLVKDAENAYFQGCINGAAMAFRNAEVTSEGG